MNPADFDLSNITDIVVVVVLLLSGILAFLRGFMHEILTIIAWIGAIVAVVFGLPYLQPFTLQQLSTHLSINTPMIASIVAGSALFLVALLVLSLLTRPIVATVNKAALNGLDRSLGFLFGLVRGYLLISLGFLIIWFLILGAKTPPTWLQTARTGPFIEYGIKLIADMIPSEWGTAELNLNGVSFGRAADDAFNTLLAPRPRSDSHEGLVPMLTPSQPPPGQPASPGSSGPDSHGYSPSETQGMDRLFQQTNP